MYKFFDRGSEHKDNAAVSLKFTGWGEEPDGRGEYINSGLWEYEVGEEEGTQRILLKPGFPEKWDSSILDEDHWCVCELGN